MKKGKRKNNRRDTQGRRGEKGRSGGGSDGRGEGGAARAAFEIEREFLDNSKNVCGFGFSLANHRLFPPRSGSVAGFTGLPRDATMGSLRLETLLGLFEALHRTRESVRAHRFLSLSLVFLFAKVSLSHLEHKHSHGTLFKRYNSADRSTLAICQAVFLTSPCRVYVYVSDAFT